MGVLRSQFSGLSSQSSGRIDPTKRNDFEFEQSHGDNREPMTDNQAVPSCRSTHDSPRALCVLCSVLCALLFRYVDLEVPAVHSEDGDGVALGDARRSV